MRADNEVVEVLAEVPDYLEWKNYVNGYCDEHNYNLKLQDENQQLKELLKECRKTLNKAKGDTVWYPVEIDHVITKIDEVLK